MVVVEGVLAATGYHHHHHFQLLIKLTGAI